MNDAVRQMLERYELRTRDDYVNALREIMQQIALLGLWRGKFFEHAAFYGGTALRVLYGLDRYSEDLDFSLLESNPGFDLGTYRNALLRELSSFGFEASFETRPKRANSAIESAFLKTGTLRQWLVIAPGAGAPMPLHPRETLKIRLEADTDPPGGFQTESRVLLTPIPFAVRAYSLPDLFAGKMHALLCRKWRSRVKGRDWYDFVWYVSHHPRLRLSHLESRMRYSGDWAGSASLDRDALMDRLAATIQNLHIHHVREEADRYVRDKASLALWSREFFLEIMEKIKTV